VDLSGDLANCGACGVACQFPNANAVCVGGACSISGCQPGYHDIDGLGANGCEYACIYTGTETCNGLDDDCDGQVDEAATCSGTGGAPGTDPDPVLDPGTGLGGSAGAQVETYQSDDDSSCACSAPGGIHRSGWWALLGLGLAVFVRRRWSRHVEV
jgi:MYXO-CTERM domain-containing protein